MSAEVEGQLLPAGPVHSLSSLHSSIPLSSSGSSNEPRPEDLPRSASYTLLSALEKEPAIATIKRTFSESVLALPPQVKTKMNDSVQPPNRTPFRRASKKARKKISSGIFSFSQDDDEIHTKEGNETETGKTEQTKSLSRSVTGTIRTLARKSWAGSRPSSPAPKDGSSVRKRSWSPSKIKDVVTPNPTAERRSKASRSPSRSPCTPAPARLLLIIRLDNQPLLAPSRTTFDRHAGPGLINQSSPYQNHSSALNTIPSADVTPQVNKKRWSLLKGLNMFNSSPGNHRPGEVTPPGSPDENGSRPSYIPGPNNAIAVPKVMSRPITPPHQACSFRFELQPHRALPQLEVRNWTLTAPRLPQTAQNILRARESRESNASGGSSGSDAKLKAKAKEIKPLKPKQDEMSNARYTGRALAEWTQVVSECRNFYIRRRQDGVPRDSLVEIPTLGVENFRSPG